MPTYSTGDTLANISAAIRPTFKSTLVQAFNRQSPTLRNIPIRKGAGQDLRWDVAFGGATADVIPEGYNWQAGDGAVDTYKSLVLPWACYGGLLELTDLQVNAVASSQEPSEFASSVETYLQMRMNQLAAKIARAINYDLFYGAGTRTSSFAGGSALTSTKSIVGLLSSVSPADGHDVGALSSYSSAATYGGIAKNAYSGAETNPMLGYGLVQASSTALSTNALDTMLTECTALTGERPGFGVVSKGVSRKYRELLRTGTNNIKLNINNGNGTYELGSENDHNSLSFDGLPFVPEWSLDERASGTGVSALGQVYLINPNYCQLVVLPNQNKWNAPQEEMMSAIELTDAQQDPIPELDISVVPLAKVGTTQRWQVTVYCQLEVTPCFHAYGYNFTV